MRQLVAHVTRARDAVGLRDRVARARHQFEQRQLVRHRGEAMEAHEGQREQSGEIDLALQEHALLGHEHVVEDRQRLHHLVPRADRMLEIVFVRAAVRRREQLQSRRVDRQRERDRVSLVLGAHRTRRQHDHFISIGRDAGVDLRAAHDDTVGALLDDSHVVVGMVLLRGPERAIALDVGLRDGDREIVVAAIRGSTC